MFFRPSTISCTFNTVNLKTCRSHACLEGDVKVSERVDQGMCFVPISEVQRRVKAPLETFKDPHRYFNHIHVDLFSHLPHSQGFTYLFTIMDQFTHCPEAVPLMDMISLSCAQALIVNWITRFGVPTHISSDRGSHFTSELWTAVGQLLGTQYHHTTAYHP